MRIVGLEHKPSLEQPARLLGAARLEREIGALRKQARILWIGREELEVPRKLARQAFGFFCRHAGSRYRIPDPDANPKLPAQDAENHRMPDHFEEEHGQAA